MIGKIIVIGSVAWDEVVELDAPLQSGGHNQGMVRGFRLGGGAANTALALLRAGNEVVVHSAVGGDTQGRELLASLKREGLNTACISNSAPATTHSMLFLDPGGERTIINLARATFPVPGRLDDRDTACVYVRSSDPKLAAVLQGCLERALVVAHVPPLAAGIRPAHILVGSADDLDADFLAEPWRSGREVAGEMLRWVVVTRGCKGAHAYSADEVLQVSAPRVNAVDTTGAGDVFAAGLIHALVRDVSMAQALRCAVDWGAASVQYEGTVPPEGFPGNSSLGKETMPE